MKKLNEVAITNNMSLKDALTILGDSSCTDYDSIVLATIVVKETIGSLSSLVDQNAAFVEDLDNYCKVHELDDALIFTNGGKAYKFYPSVSDSIELDKDLLDETAIPSEYYDRSPRLSHKMIKDASKRIAAGEIPDFANISAACSVVTTKTVKSFEVDPVTHKKVVKKEVK